MEGLGINVPFLFAQLFSLAFLVGWPLLAFVALARLQKRALADTARALWALIILAMPFVGALAFFVVRPGAER